MLFACLVVAVNAASFESSIAAPASFALAHLLFGPFNRWFLSDVVFDYIVDLHHSGETKRMIVKVALISSLDSLFEGMQEASFGGLR